MSHDPFVARAYQCWDCGRQVSADEVQRHEVHRHSVSSSGNVRTRHQRVNLCPSCVAKRDRMDTIKGVIAIAAILAVLLYVFVIR